MGRRYKPEHFIDDKQARRLFAEAEQFEATGKLPRTAELRMFAKGIFNNDDVSTLGMMTKLIYRRLAQCYIGPTNNDYLKGEKRNVEPRTNE